MLFEGDPIKRIGNSDKGNKTIQNTVVLKFPDIVVNDKIIAVVMPFDRQHYLTPEDNPVYSAIKMVTQELSLQSVRADEIVTLLDIKDDFST